MYKQEVTEKNVNCLGGGGGLHPPLIKNVVPGEVQSSAQIYGEKSFKIRSRTSATICGTTIQAPWNS